MAEEEEGNQKVSDRGGQLMELGSWEGSRSGIQAPVRELGFDPVQDGRGGCR